MKRDNYKRLLMTSLYFVAGLLIGLFGIGVGSSDDAPGATVIGIILMIMLILLGVKKCITKSEKM